MTYIHGAFYRGSRITHKTDMMWRIGPDIAIAVAFNDLIGDSREPDVADRDRYVVVFQKRGDECRIISFQNTKLKANVN